MGVITETQCEIRKLPVETAPFWRKKRYVIVLLAFFGFFNVYALRVNLSVAIVAMTEVRNVTVTNATGTYITQKQDFDWDSEKKGLVLSSFFYGYITTQLLGGYLGYKFGGNRIFGLGIAATSLLTLLTPLAANFSIYALLAVRIIEGIFEGLTFPCMADVWSRYAPPLERSRMTGFAFVGNYVGTVVAMPASGYLASVYGWESVFYVFGCIGLIWAVIWLFIVKRSPEEDKSMSEIERTYIIKSIGTVRNQQPKFSEVPWKSIWTSGPLWAINCAHFCEIWGFITLLTMLPSFLKDTLDYDLKESGLLSAAPYLTMSILAFVSSYFADWFQVKKILTTTQVRRYFNCFAFMSQTIFMMLAAYCLHPVYSVLLLTIGVGAGAFTLSGFTVNHLDLAPKYAAILYGISNFFGSIPGIISPHLAGIIVKNKTADEWKIVFYISAGVYLFGCIIYWIFASGKIQPWAKEKETIDYLMNEEIPKTKRPT